MDMKYPLVPSSGRFNSMTSSMELSYNSPMCTAIRSRMTLATSDGFGVSTRTWEACSRSYLSCLKQQKQQTIGNTHRYNCQYPHRLSISVKGTYHDVSIDPIDPDPGSRKGKGNSKTQAKDDLFGGPAGEDNTLAPRPRIIGYTAFRYFAIVVKDLTKFEEIYQGIVDNGINRVDSVEYRSSQEKFSREDLRDQAVRVAKERAEGMAHRLGATLSAIKSIGNASGSFSNRESRGVLSGRGGMMGGYVDPFSSREAPMIDGQITLQSSVDVVFYLGNAELKE